MSPGGDGQGLRVSRRGRDAYARRMLSALVLATASLLSGGTRPPGTCGLATTLCAQNGRFEVTVDWQGTPLGPSLPAQTVPVTDDSGYFWFFTPENVEVMVKVLDGRPVNGAYWVFYGALSNLAYRVTVRDTLTSAVWTHDNRWGEMASVADTKAFPATEGGFQTRASARAATSSVWAPLGPLSSSQTVQIFSLAVDPRSPEIVYAAFRDYLADAGGVARSTDGGSHWSQTALPANVSDLLVDPASADHVYAVGTGGFWRSSNGGLSWTQSAVGDSLVDSYALAGGGGRIYLGLGSRVLVSTDSGRSWQELSVPLSSPEVVSAITVDSSNAGTIYVGSGSGSIFRSEDSGTSWTLLRSVPDQWVAAITVDPLQPEALHVGTMYGGVTPGGPPLPSPYLRSVDGGTTWQEI
jgi:hypothetical protein